MSHDAVVRGSRILLVLLVFYAVTQFWHEYYYWSGVFDPASQTSTGSTYFHWGQLWEEVKGVLNENFGWVRASVLALALYIFIIGRSRWRGWTMGIPTAIFLAGLAMGLGVYFGLKTVGSEIGAVGSEVRAGLGAVSNATVTLETTSGIDVNVTH